MARESINKQSLARQDKPSRACSAVPSFSDSGALGAIQQHVGTWQRKTFGNARRTYSITSHIMRESWELRCAAASGNKENTRMETADLVILAIGVAESEGFDLATAIRDKMNINLARKWKQPDAHGVVEHLK